MRGRAHAVVVIAAAIAMNATTARALAETRAAAQLDFAVDAGGATCPDEAAFRERVAVRLGHDPFVDASTSRVHVRFTRRGPRLVANVDIDEAGRPAGSRRLDELATRCEVLFDAVAATVAIALDPVTRAPPAASASTTPPATFEPPNAGSLADAPARTTTSSTGPEAPSPAIEAAPKTRPYAMLDGLASVGVTPGATLGAQAGLGLHRAALSVAAEGRVETTPGAEELKSGDRVSSSAFFAGIAPCLRVGVARLCLGARVGSLQSSSRDVTRPSLESSFAAAAFARAVAVLPLGSAFAFRIGAEGAVALVRTTLSVDGQAIWIAPPVNGSLLAGVEWAAP